MAWHGLKFWGQDVKARPVDLAKPAAFTKVTALGVEEQRDNVIVSPADGGSPWTTLGDGFAADAQIEVQSDDDRTAETGPDGSRPLGQQRR